MGTLYLIYLTFSDFKNNMMVDDRYNWFMSGATFALLSHFDRKLAYVLSLAIMTAALVFFLKNRKVMGEADISTISWLFFGFGIISLPLLIWFFFVFFCVGMVYGVLKYIIAKIMTKYGIKRDYKMKMPYYVVILISFVLNNILFRLY